MGRPHEEIEGHNSTFTEEKHCNWNVCTATGTTLYNVRGKAMAPALRRYCSDHADAARAKGLIVREAPDGWRRNPTLLGKL